MLSTDQLLYILPLIVSTLILGWNTLYSWKRREVAGAREFAAYVFVELLVEQLAGEINYQQDQGTEVSLKFNIE